MFLQSLQHRFSSIRPSRFPPLIRTNPLCRNTYSTRPLSCTSTRPLSCTSAPPLPCTFTSSKPHPFFTPARPGRTGFQSSSPTRLNLMPKRLFTGQSHQSSQTIMPACWLLLSLNTMVFGAICYSKFSNDRNLQLVLQANTGVSAAAWDQGRWWTTLTSAFTHHGLLHYAFNMMTMVSICRIIDFVPTGFGGSHIIALALGAGMSSSAAYIWSQKRKAAASQGTSSGFLKSYSKSGEDAARHYYTPAIGASGSVMGLMGFAACLMPRFPMQFMFIPVPIPLWVMVGLYGLADTYMMDSKNTFVAHAGHLGGLAFGVVYYVANFRRARTGILRELSDTLRRR